MENRFNLFIIGMMGSWKSTVGRELAGKLNFEFVDVDDAIEEVMDMKISDIFKEFGENRFRKMETAFFSEKSKQYGHVFSTGGGIILEEKNRNILQKRGITFLLHASTKTLASRISNTTKRPLLNDSDNIQQRLDQIWNDRKLYYRNSAHHTIITDNLKPKKVLEKICNILELTYANN